MKLGQQRALLPPPPLDAQLHVLRQRRVKLDESQASGASCQEHEPILLSRNQNEETCNVASSGITNAALTSVVDTVYYVCWTFWSLEEVGFFYYY